MIRVKICGLRSIEDIGIVNALLPDYAGFVFCESKRRVDAAHAEALCAGLDGRIKKVGVFCNQDRRVIERIRDLCGLDVIQLHGDEPPCDCHYGGCEVWKAVRVETPASVEQAKAYNTARILFDTHNKNAYGGAGKAFDWKLLDAFEARERVVLAGGLDPENVARAVRRVRPFAVDVSSGVETDGKKDYQKVRLFIAETRRTERK